MARAPKGTPTDTNVFALAQHFGASDVASNAVRPSSVSHLRRCLAAGLAVVDGTTLRLTEAGRAAIRARAARYGYDVATEGR